MNQNLRVIARVIARQGKVEELKTLLRSIVEPTRKETGCIQYELLQSKTDPTEFIFVEEWTCENALNQHLASSHIQAALNQLDQLAMGEPEIRSYTQLS
jgi:quinol monooxygenase YgiN